MFAPNASAPVAPQSVVPRDRDTRAVHLLLVRTPRLNPRGLAWLQRSKGEFDGVQLQRCIRMEKLSLG